MEQKTFYADFLTVFKNLNLCLSLKTFLTSIELNFGGKKGHLMTVIKFLKTLKNFKLIQLHPKVKIQQLKIL